MKGFKPICRHIKGRRRSYGGARRLLGKIYSFGLEPTLQACPSARHSSRPDD
jgi:hypothetical protein